MEDNSEKNKRIAKNTLLLYMRTALVMVVTLFTSRVILKNLGVEDYGLYNAVGGIVIMFNFITGSLSNAISRYLQVALGKDSIDRIRTVFSTSIIVLIILATIVAILAEFGGLWFLYYKMNIPDGRLYAGQWVLHFSIMTFIINLLSVPYNAVIIAHEKMSAFAYISILDASFKLLIAYFLTISPIDKLVFYALLLCFAQLVIRFVYTIYCKKNFFECSGPIFFDKSLLKEMTGFAGWNLISNGAVVLNNQGINLLMNVFFGVVANAARGVANQVNSAIQQLITNFAVAYIPAIVKNYAAGNKDYALNLTCLGAKYSYLMMMLLALPIFFESETILSLWLGVVPENAVLFLRWTLACSLVSVFGNALFNLVMADGRIKMFQICISVLNILPFPLAWLFFSLGYSAEYSYICYFIVYIIDIFVRYFLAKRVTNLSVNAYLYNVILRVFLVTIISSTVPFAITHIIDSGILRLVMNGAISILFSIVIIYLIGLESGEKEFVNSKFKITV